VASHTLAGAVTVVANVDRVLDTQTVGYADIGAGKTMTADAIFWIASQSKPITATALMMLVDEGKVALNDPVEKYLPEFKDQWLAAYREGDVMLLRKPKQTMTVRHLLSHASGMPFKSALEEPTLDQFTLRSGVRSYTMTPLNSEPGTKFDYSNAGINTAGRIIEVVSGMPYEDFLQKRLFDPLGMKDTTFWPSGEQLGRIAKSYKPNSSNDGLEEIKIGQLRYPLDDRLRQPMPAGGLFSTAADVTTFCRMILNGGEWNGKRYVSEDAVKQMATNQLGSLPQSYGLGWAAGKNPGDSFGHGGAHSTQMNIDPQKKLVLVFMVQHAGFPGGDNGKVHGAFVNAAKKKFAP
jgi:CubicO group peptidase (beta-lactamase class C family)